MSNLGKEGYLIVDIISIMSARYRSANCKTQRMRRGREYITVCPPLNVLN